MFRDARFELDSIKASVEEMGPFQNVFMMECERTNALLGEMIRSLLELDMGFKGDLTMSEAMETLQECLYLEKVGCDFLCVCRGVCLYVCGAGRTGDGPH
jgi:dynein heavy chain, axonemal